jgi:hypothetical protein
VARKERHHRQLRVIADERTDQAAGRNELTGRIRRSRTTPAPGARRTCSSLNRTRICPEETCCPGCTSTLATDIATGTVSGILPSTRTTAGAATYSSMVAMMEKSTEQRTAKRMTA